MGEDNFKYLLIILLEVDIQLIDKVLVVEDMEDAEIKGQTYHWLDGLIFILLAFLEGLRRDIAHPPVLKAF
jgi:hypothetical protein